VTGAQFLTYMKRRLAEQGLTVDAERDNELLDYATEGRDGILQVFAEAAPVVVKQIVSFDPPVGVLYSLPAGTKDPYRALCVRDAGTGRELDPSSSIQNDAGEYVWRTLRQLQLADWVSLEGALEAEMVLHAGAIDSATAEAAIGLPTTCHRAAAKLGVVLALTADEQSDATNAMGLFQREMEILERLYGEYDGNGGLALRNALMKSLGTAYGDSLS
jgi:hypothetical protein